MPAVVFNYYCFVSISFAIYSSISICDVVSGRVPPQSACLILPCSELVFISLSFRRNVLGIYLFTLMYVRVYILFVLDSLHFLSLSSHFSLFVWIFERFAGLPKMFAHLLGALFICLG